MDYTLAVGDLRHLPADPGAVLPWLGDTIPVPLPLRSEVVSIGDVLVAAGLAQLLATAMLLGTASAGPRRYSQPPLALTGDVPPAVPADSTTGTANE